MSWEYVSVAEIRTAGLTDSTTYPDGVVSALIETYCEYVNKITGQFFKSLSLDFTMNGTGTKYLHLPFPIIELTALYRNDETTAEDIDNYVVYNRQPYPDDRKNPKIVLKNISENFFRNAGNYYNGGLIFQKGSLNQRLVGTFGWTDVTATPNDIKRAVTMLVLANRAALFLGEDEERESSFDGHLSGLKKEMVDGNMYEYMAGSGSKTSGLIGGASTGIPEVDQILRNYRKPLAMGISSVQDILSMVVS